MCGWSKDGGTQGGKRRKNSLGPLSGVALELNMLSKHLESQQKQKAPVMG